VDGNIFIHIMAWIGVQLLGQCHGDRLQVLDESLSIHEKTFSMPRKNHRATNSVIRV